MCSQCSDYVTGKYLKQKMKLMCLLLCALDLDSIEKGPVETRQNQRAWILGRSRPNNSRYVRMLSLFVVLDQRCQIFHFS